MATVRTLMEDESLQLSLVAASRPALDRPLTGAFITDLPDPSRFLHDGVVVLTSGLWARDETQAHQFLTALATSRVGGLVVGLVEIGLIPDHVIRLARELDLPLLTTGDGVAFASVAEAVEATSPSGSTIPLQQLLDWNAALARAVSAGASVTTLLDLFRTDTGITAWHLDGAGRLGPDTAPDVLRAHAGLLAGRILREQAGFDATVGDRRLRVVPIGTGHDAAVDALVLDAAPPGLEPTLATLADAVRLSLAPAQIVAGARDARLRVLLAEVRDGAVPGDVAARLAFEGGDPSAIFTAILADGGALPSRAAGLIIERALISAGVSVVLAGTTADGVVVALLQHDSATDIADALATLLEAERDLLAGSRIRFGVSDPARAIRLGDAVEEARMRMHGVDGVTTVIGRDSSAHTFQALLRQVPSRSRRAFGSSILGPLLDHDERHSGDLMRSLSVFLDAACAWQPAADTLHVHPSTLRYRIKRVEEITGRNLALAQDRADLQVAIASLD